MNPAIFREYDVRGVAERDFDAGFARDLGFDTFLFWPNDEPEEQMERFATEVAPAFR